jgi:Flp pilus assembly protein TadD
MVRVQNIEQAMQTAVAHQVAGRFGEAELLYRRILALRPDSAAAFSNLGNCLAAKKRIDAAILCFRQALLVQPDFADAAQNLAAVCLKAGRTEDAVAALNDVLRLRPNMPEAYNTMGVSLCNLAKYKEAAGYFRRALKLKSDNPSAYNNLGNALCAMGLYDASIGSYHRALAQRPNYPAAHLNLGMILLMKENFVRGWPEYEWRWRLDDPRMRLSLNKPWWDGGPLQGRTVVLYNEQGFGDAIQFCRYIPLVAAQGGKVALVCQPALAGLFRKLPGIKQISFPHQPMPKHDFHCPLLTLPGVLGTTLKTIPGNVPYLFADRDLAKKWQTKIPNDDRLKVGLVWAGQPTHANDRNRSASLAEYAPLCDVPNVWFCSLQKGNAAQQIYSRTNHLQLVNWDKELKNFSDTAAVIANLDLVITVDTSVAHLAGAMGKPVWVLIPFVPDWRWLLERSDSPWYPTLRLFRQPRFGDWATPVANVVEALANKASSFCDKENVKMLHSTIILSN